MPLINESTETDAASPTRIARRIPVDIGGCRFKRVVFGQLSRIDLDLFGNQVVVLLYKGP